MAASHYIVLSDGHLQEHPTQDKGKFSIILQCLIGDILASSAIIILPVQILMDYILYSWCIAFYPSHSLFHSIMTYSSKFHFKSHPDNIC